MSFLRTNWSPRMIRLLARSATTVVVAFAGVAPSACASTENDDPSNIIVVKGAGADVEDELELDDKTRLVRGTVESVISYFELKAQARTQAMKALRETIANKVDKDYKVFEEMALESDLLIKRNMAVMCLGFARENRVEARTSLILIAENKKERPFLRTNAIRSVGILLDPETPVAPVITLLASTNAEIKTEAANTFKELARVKKTPKVLTPQYHLAIERLAAMLYDESNTNGRIAAIWALSNLRHPTTFSHLVAALGDSKEEVQLGALYGLVLLGDQRAIEPLLSFLGDGQTSAAESWCVKALKTIAVQSGLATDQATLIPLGTSPRKWREFFRKARMN